MQVQAASRRLKLKEPEVIGLQACRLHVHLGPVRGLPQVEELLEAGPPWWRPEATSQVAQLCSPPGAAGAAFQAAQLHVSVATPEVNAAGAADGVHAAGLAMSEAPDSALREAVGRRQSPAGAPASASADACGVPAAAGQAPTAGIAQQDLQPVVSAAVGSAAAQCAGQDKCRQ